MAKVWSVAAELGLEGIFVPEDGGEVIDDHVPLIQAGFRVIDLIDLDYSAWHTTLDLPDRTSPRSLEAVGRVLAEVVYRERP